MSEHYETVEHGTATSDGYCYACPAPILSGQAWRRERVGHTVPHMFRLVHDTCPPSTAGTPEAFGSTAAAASSAGEPAGQVDYRRAPAGPSNTYGAAPASPRHPAAPAGPSATAHVISLLLGIPVAALMYFLLAGAVVFDSALPTLPLMMAASSTAGCVLAVTGMRARPRRHRALALVLTILPATVVGFFVALVMVFAWALGNPN